MTYSTLQLDYGPERAILTLNRPDKRNAINPQMISELMTAFDEIERKKVRVVIMAANGPAFCAGMDLEMLATIAQQSAQENQDDSRRMAKLFRRIWSFPRPLIAAVNGAALAGGCGIATLCDFTLAVPQACFGYTEVRIGFLPAIVSVFLARQIGDKRARDLLLTGRKVAAQEALQLGLVTEIVEPDKLRPRADELADYLVEVSPGSLSRAKRLLVTAEAATIDADLERAVLENARIRCTGNFKEGVASFLEKRKPIWTDE